MKKPIFLLAKFVLTALLIYICAYVGGKLDYWSQLKVIDNLIGAIPLLLLLVITGMLVALTWKRYRNAATSTIAISALTIIFALLFIPAVTGNWYPFARVFDSPAQTSNIETPPLATLDKESTLMLTENLPRLDGATALLPVYKAFANAAYDDTTMSDDIVVCTNTTNAYNRIIADDCDIIFVASPSANQIQAAKDAGVELVFTPIGWEAFVFLAGKTNPIDGITTQQTRNIYSGKTAYWKALGWNDGGRIIAFQRPDGSGSQTGLQGLMGKLPIQKPQPLPDSSLVGQGSMMSQVSVEWQGVQPAIGYSYRYYATVMYPNPDAKLLAVDGVYPSNETIINGEYPHASNFYAITNGQPEGNVKLLIDWILSAQGQYLIEQTGYVPMGTR